MQPRLSIQRRMARHTWQLPKHGCQTQLPLSCPVAHGGWQWRTVLHHAVARTPSAALSIDLEGAECILSACTAPMTSARLRVGMNERTQAPP
jgi:hypothetical protein